MTISFRGDMGGILVGREDDGKEYKLEFDICKKCRGRTMIMTPFGEGDSKSKCKCSTH